MGQKGRPPKPIEQKRLLGNPGRRPLPKEGELAVLPAASSVPEPERPLEADGYLFWHRIWSAGIPWISPTTDVELLMMVCEAIDESRDLVERVRETQDKSDRRALRALNSEIVSNLSLLGFSPADRTRLNLAEVKRQSKLEQLMAMRDEL